MGRGRGTSDAAVGLLEGRRRIACGGRLDGTRLGVLPRLDDFSPTVEALETKPYFMINAPASIELRGAPGLWCACGEWPEGLELAFQRRIGENTAACRAEFELAHHLMADLAGYAVGHPGPELLQTGVTKVMSAGLDGQPQRGLFTGTGERDSREFTGLVSANQLEAVARITGLRAQPYSLLYSVDRGLLVLTRGRGKDLGFAGYVKAKT